MNFWKSTGYDFSKFSVFVEKMEKHNSLIFYVHAIIVILFELDWTE